MKPAYIGYEYKEVTVPDREASRFLDGYASFGWAADENRPAVTGGRLVTLYLKRDRKIINRMELTRLQRHFEACMQEIRQLERAPARTAARWALAAGLAGTAFLAGAVFAVTHDPPGYLLMAVLAVPGFAGWIAPVLFHRRLLAAQTRRVQPFLDAKYEEVDQLCEKGHALL